MQTIIFMNENGANYAVSGTNITVIEPNSPRQYVPQTTETITQKKAFGGSKEIEVAKPAYWKEEKYVEKNSLCISSAGQGYRGTGQTHDAPNVTFSDYAEALTQAVAHGTPHVIIDLRPAQQKNIEAVKKTL